MEPIDQNYQKDEVMRFLVIPFDILGIKDINLTDKFVLARIAGFQRFYESSQATSEFLGLSKVQVERAKRKLAKLGYIIELADTGRGKVYRCQDFYRIVEQIGQKSHVRPTKNVRPDMTKMSDQTYQKCQTENKERIKKEHKGDENVADDEKEANKQEYGREDINGLIELWEAETGISIKGQQNQRRQLYNLVRKYGLEGTQKLIERVGAAIRSGDRFAPQIATPSDLTGKYSKLPKLEMWEKRNEIARPFGQGSGYQDDRPTPSYLSGGIPDYNGAFIVKSDEERAKVSKMFKEARKTLPFLQKKKGGK